MESIKQNSFSIHYIEDPSEKLQLEAIKRNHWSIKYIKNPSLSAQLEAVKQCIDCIFYIKRPEPETAFYCITNNPDLLKIRYRKIDHQKLRTNYFQKLPLYIQKMLVESNPLFVTIIPNLHPSLKNSIHNLKNIGLF